MRSGRREREIKKMCGRERDRNKNVLLGDELILLDIDIEVEVDTGKDPDPLLLTSRLPPFSVRDALKVVLKESSLRNSARGTPIIVSRP